MAKRELIDTGKDKRYVWRNKQGQFNELDDVGRSAGFEPATQRLTGGPKRISASPAVSSLLSHRSAPLLMR